MPRITENWEYYSKIIFKYVNNAVRPSFEKKDVEYGTCESPKKCMRPQEKTLPLGKAQNALHKRRLISI